LKPGLCDAGPASSRLCHAASLLAARTNEMVYKYKICFLQSSRFLASLSGKDTSFYLSATCYANGGGYERLGLLREAGCETGQCTCLISQFFTSD
jgi:hypothetical protein